MRWSAGRYGTTSEDRLPRNGSTVSGLEAVWTTGWPPGRVRAVSHGPVALAVIGDCGADEDQLADALPSVRAGRWRKLTRWPGSYLVIARNGTTLAVIGDLAGQHPVYWRSHEGAVWWATSALALAALDGAPVDPTALAAHLALAQPDVLGQRSLLRCVERVPGGHLLLIDTEGARAVRFEPAEYASVDLPAAAATVRAALGEAVATRLDGRPVSTDLAGLDSTALACLAAQRGPVTAVTFADERLRDDDLPYATRTAAAVPRLTHHAVAGTANTVYYDALNNLTRLPMTDAPNAYAVTASIKRAVLDTIATHHSSPGLHLTGSGGDAVLSAPSSYIADLLREGQHRRAWQHALGHARLRHTSAWSVLRRSRPASRTGLAGSWSRTAAELRGPARPWAPQATRPVSWTPLLATADWVSPDIRRQLAAALDEAAAQMHNAPARLTAWGDRQDLSRLGVDTTGWREIAAAEYGIDLIAPYLDNEVIRACLAVPADQRGAPGRYKPLLNAAFTGTGVLPDFVLTRTTKGGFNALAYAGLRENAPVLRDLLGPCSRLAAAGLVTEQPVAWMLQRAAAGQPTAQGSLHLAVAAEVWLRQLHTTTSTSDWWEVNSRVAAA
ncbi:albusnodin/ikarugamycin family macrolactam cyclase [Streptomyces lydicus]|uniref:albusnodin/ikarugamycin family macrolactam cyclase n=1 Tax=Streptomyces lydicus TaxID=47763 RepID=UPI0036E36F2E